MDYESYMRNLDKKMTNFLNKRPVRLTKYLTPSSLILQDKDTNKKKTFEIDITKDPKNFIHEINEWLLNDLCPILIDVENHRRDLTKAEKEDLIKEGTAIDSILGKKIETTHFIEYRIERVLMLTDILFVRNMETGLESRYEMKMPVSLFLRNVRRKWTPKESFEVFKNKSILLNSIDPLFKERT